MKWVELESIITDIDYGITESATTEDTGCKFLRITDIREGRINWDKVPYCKCNDNDEKKYSLHYGDIVFARTGSVGNTCLINNLPEKAVFASYLIRIKPNLKLINPEFLSLYFQTTSYWKQVEIESVGAIQGGLNASKLKKLIIPYPSLPEQQRIAAILQKADRLRGLRRFIRHLSDGYLQSVFLEIFGDPATNPMGWKIDFLANLCQPKNGIKAGPFGSSLKKEFYSKSGYRIYGQEQVIAGDFSLGNYYISEELFEKEFLPYEVKPSDILISLVGTFGKTIIVPESVEPGIINPRLLKISPIKEILNSVFLSKLIQFPSIQKELLNLSHGGTMGILNAGQLKEYKIIYPPLSVQDEFAVYVGKYEKLQQKMIESEHQTEMLFQSLLHNAFRGEL